LDSCFMTGTFKRCLLIAIWAAFAAQMRR
jgi:hypothetical protein